MFTVRKIAIVSSFFPPKDDVSAQYSYYLAKELVDMDVRVEVFTLWKNDACGTKRMDEIDVTCIPAKKLLNRFYFISPKYYKNILKELEEFKPDCVVTNDYYRTLSVLGARAARELRIPCICINHLSKPLSDKNPIINHFIKRYDAKTLHINKKYRAVFAATDPSQSDHLRKMNAVKRYEIPYGIETDISPLPAAKKKLGIKEDTLMYAINSDGTNEDTTKIMKVLNSIRHFSGPQISLVVIGSKPKGYKDDTKDVIFTGEISKEMEIAIKYDCDVYVYFVRADKTYQSLYEAGLMSTASVCILTDSDARFSVVEDTVSGIVIYEDVKQIESALQKLRVHTKLRDEYARVLRNAVEQKHNWYQSALALIDAVWELNGGRRHG